MMNILGRHVAVILSVAVTFVVAHTCLVAQQLNRQMKVESLEESNKINPESDKSLVIVRSQIPNLRFDSNRSIEKVNKVSSGDWEVWLPPGTHILKIDSEGFQRLEYTYNFAKKRSYEMVIKAIGFAPTARADEQLVEIVFNCSEDSVYSSYGDFPPTLSRGRTISYKMPVGEYEFRFQRAGFADETRRISVNRNENFSIELKRGTSTVKGLSLPGIVRITSEPSGAEIILNGQKLGNTPYQGELTAGEHHLELRKALYYADVSTFNLREGQSQAIPRKLKPRFGYLTVASTPKNAKIFLDGKLLGNAPLGRKEVESGQHTIRLEAELHHQYEQAITIRDGEPETVNTALRAAYGTLEVSTTPEDGAEIFLDNQKVGSTPYKNTRLPSGKYLLKVSKPLFEDAEEEIVIADEQLVRKALTLSKNFCELRVKAPSSRIFVDGRDVGAESYTARLAPGRYALKAVRGEKYIPAEQEVFLAVGDTREIELQPQPRLGSVSVMVEPFEASDAEVFVNEVQKGNAPLVLPLVIGSYSITAKKSGFLDVSEQLAIRENEKQKLILQMLTYEGSRQQGLGRWNTAKWIGVVATIASAAATGYFYSAAETDYDYYRKATSTDEAVSLRESTQRKDLYFKIGIGVSGAALATTLYSWLREATY